MLLVLQTNRRLERIIEAHHHIGTVTSPPENVGKQGFLAVIKVMFEEVVIVKLILVEVGPT